MSFQDSLTSVSPTESFFLHLFTYKPSSTLEPPDTSRFSLLASVYRLLEMGVAKPSKKSGVGASDSLIPEERAIEILAATLIQVRDLVFAVRSFRSNNISSYSHQIALALWTPMFNHLSLSTRRTRLPVIVCFGENLAIGVSDMGHPPVMVRLFIVPRLIAAWSDYQTSPQGSAMSQRL